MINSEKITNESIARDININLYGNEYSFLKFLGKSLTFAMLFAFYVYWTALLTGYSRLVFAIFGIFFLVFILQVTIVPIINKNN